MQEMHQKVRFRKSKRRIPRVAATWYELPKLPKPVWVTIVMKDLKTTGQAWTAIVNQFRNEWLVSMLKIKKEYNNRKRSPRNPDSRKHP